MRAPFFKVAGAEIIACHIEQPCHKTEGEKDDVICEKDEQRGKVCRAVDNFRDAVRLFQADMGDTHKEKDEECSRARAVKTVINANDKRHGAAEKHCFLERERLFFCHGFLSCHIESGDGKNEKHGSHEYTGVKNKSDMGTQR